MAIKRKVDLPWGALTGALALGALAQFLLWTPGLGLVMAPRLIAGWILMALAGIWIASLWTRLPEAPAEPKGTWPRWADGTALVLLLLLSLALRTVDLDKYPNAGFRDEGENGNVSIQILKDQTVSATGTRLPSYIEEVSQNSAGYFYLSALSLKVFGISMKSMRYTGVFWGVLSVLLFYILARAMLGQPLALAAALGLAALRWNLNFSRTALLGIHTMATSLPVMYFLWKGVQAADPPLPPKKGRLRELALWGGLALAYLSYNIRFSEWGGADSALSWLGFLVRAVMHAPLAWSLWSVRKDARSLNFGLMGAALGFCLYSYLASRLVVISVIFIWTGFFLRAQGQLQGSAGRRLGLAVAAFLGGILVLAQASTYKGANPGPMLKAIGWALFIGGALLIAYAKLAALRAPGAYRAWVRPLLLGVAGCWIMAAPLLNYMVLNRGQMLSRTQRVWVWGNEDYDARTWGSKLIESVRRTVGMINVEGDGNPRHNDPGRPMFDPLLAWLFGIGLFMVLWRIGRPLPLFLLLWLQGHWLASYIGIEAPQAFRGICSMAPALIIAFYPLLPVSQALRLRMGKGWRLSTLVVLVLVMAGVGVKECYDYFVLQPKHPGVWSEFSAGEFEMGKRLHDLQPEHGGKRITQGLFRPDWSDSWTTKFTAYPERRYQAFDVGMHVPMGPNRAQPDTDYFYVLDEAYLPLKELLYGYYPHGKAEELRHPITNELIFWSFLAPAEDIALIKPGGTGLGARYFNSKEDGNHWNQANLAFKRVDPFILFNWTVTPISGHFSVQWDGKIKAPTSGSYNFNVYSNNIASVTVDGKTVLERKEGAPGDRWTGGKIKLDAGWHQLRVRYAETRNYSRMELWWTLPGESPEVKHVVPGDLLRPE